MPIAASCLTAIIASPASVNNAFADESEEPTFTMSDKWMLRLGAYFIDGADTTVAIDLTIGDETFYESETVFSDIKYELYALRYNY